MTSRQQRTEEWLEGSDWALHERQFDEPYRITVQFSDFLNRNGCLLLEKEARILDVGAGMGANIYFLARRYPNVEFIGLDINPECVDRGNERLRGLGAANCRLETADLYNLDLERYSGFDGIVSFATLSWLSGLEEAARALAALKPRWIAATSLFDEGLIDCVIETRDYSRPLPSSPCTTKFYNVYSLPRTRNLLKQLSYPEFHSERFDIDIDLTRPASGGMGTYTELLRDGRRLQFSGPLLMPWHFILARQS